MTALLKSQPPGLQDHFELSFGPYRLRPDGILLRDSTAIPLPPKELAILRLLVSNADRIVPSEQLHRGAWGDTHVSPDSLPRCISSLRARLEHENCIATVYKRGYRFNLPVHRGPVSASAESLHRGFAEVLSRTGVLRETTGLPELPKIAILPFIAGDGAPEDSGAAIAEEIIVRLARNQEIVANLIARDSVFALAAMGRTAHEVGLALRADLALAGTIVAFPLHFRLRAEMIRVADAVQIWVEDFLVPRALLQYADARMAKRIATRIRDDFAAPAS